MSELQPPSDLHVNGGAAAATDPVTIPTEPTAGPTKRQRRPSVRLGEIGDQHTYDNHRRHKPHQWKYSSKDSKATKTRQLMNLSGAVGLEFNETLTLDPRIDDKAGNNVVVDSSNNNNNIVNVNNNNNVIGGWKVGELGNNNNNNNNNNKRGFSVSAKRVRTNWGVKMDGGDERFDNEDDYDDVDRYSDGSGSQFKDHSMDYANKDGPSDNWGSGLGLERNGVRVWLNQLGLGRYYSVFEVHEVDDEVLPLLTLEDLKDMGINAVGSRRKMFCSIQKLGKGFS